MHGTVDAQNLQLVPSVVMACSEESEQELGHPTALPFSAVTVCFPTSPLVLCSPQEVRSPRYSRDTSRHHQSIPPQGTTITTSEPVCIDMQRS
ncbi:hypothetical protein SKAU_G00023870 [Synaphobranchus kaupii]|uniref:Uncharacterized protein n=1 Tax=Synaphobranchus kaupii TaxID=118154 RepID=A0A9Q1GDQ7_SYNKA|nr:hypothetical protein SKAU_G00023870 [Synaphobranchus kaupii]